MQKLIDKKALDNDVSRLDKAWSEPETFVFYSEKSGVSDSWIEGGMSKFPEEFHKDHFVLLTSGSTGQPKLVIGSRRRAELLVEALHEIQDSEPVKATVLMLPLTYCYAFVNQWLWSRIFKRELLVTRGFREPDKVKESLLKIEDGMLCLVGAQVPLFVQHFGNISFPGIIRLHFAGGPFPQNEMGTIRKLFPNARIYNNYGCAEAMPRLTIRSAEESDDPCNIGMPLPGIKMKSGENGEIFFRSPYSAVGFFGGQELRAIRENDWISTGDLGKEIEDGYWWLTGRANEVFKRFGEKIALPQLLMTISTQWSGHAAFYMEKDKTGAEGHVLVISPEPTEKQLQAILQAFRKNHARAHWPVRIESTNSFPLLSNGKVDRLALPRIKEKKLQWQHRI